MDIRERGAKVLLRSILISVFLLGMALYNSYLWRLFPGPLTLILAIVGWACAWAEVNMALAFRQRMELLFAVEMGDSEGLYRVGRVNIYRHALANMLFRDPMRLYR